MVTKEQVTGMTKDQFIDWVWVPVRKVVHKTCRVLNFRDWEDNLAETLIEVEAKRGIFDPAISSWNTFLYNVARYKCMHLCRDKSDNPAYMQEFWMKANKLEAQVGELTDRELASGLNIPQETVTRRRILRRVTEYLEDIGYEWVVGGSVTDYEANRLVALGLLREGIQALTPRQREIMGVLLETDSCTETAQRFKVSVNNVCHHRKRAIRKLHFSLRDQEEVLLGVLERPLC